MEKIKNEMHYWNKDTIAPLEVKIPEIALDGIKQIEDLLRKYAGFEDFIDASKQASEEAES